jgi:hypothetical protein
MESVLTPFMLPVFEFSYPRILLFLNQTFS